MAGANYMGGKRNSARTRSKDSRGRAEKHHFGRKRVELLQKSLAAPHSAAPVISNRASQQAEQPIELNHASRDAGNQQAKAVHDLYPLYHSGRDGERSGSKHSSRVLAAMDNDPTSVSYRSAISEILRVSKTTGLSALKGRPEPKPRAVPSSSDKDRSTRFSPPANAGNRLHDYSGSAAHRSPPRNQQDDSVFVDGSGMGDDAQTSTPFAYDPDIDCLPDEGYAASPSSHAGSSRDFETEIQARYVARLSDHSSQANVESASAPALLGSSTSAGAEKLGSTLKSPPPPRLFSSSAASISPGLSDIRSSQPSMSLRSEYVLHIGDLLEEPDAWDATGKALGLSSSRQSGEIAQPASHHDARPNDSRLDVELAMNSQPPEKVSSDSENEPRSGSATPTEQHDELDMDIDWEILDHDDLALDRDNAYPDAGTTTGQKLPDADRMSEGLQWNPKAVDAATRVITNSPGIDLDALFPEDDGMMYTDVNPSAEQSITPSLSTDAKIPFGATRTAVASVTTSRPPPNQIISKRRAPASMSLKPPSQPLAISRPVSSARPRHPSPRPENFLPFHSNGNAYRVALDMKPPTPRTPYSAHLGRADVASSSVPRSSKRKAAVPRPSSSQASKREPSRGHSPSQPAPTDDFLDALFDDVMPNLQSDTAPSSI